MADRRNNDLAQAYAQAYRQNAYRQNAANRYAAPTTSALTASSLTSSALRASALKASALRASALRASALAASARPQHATYTPRTFPTPPQASGVDPELFAWLLTWLFTSLLVLVGIISTAVLVLKFMNWRVEWHGLGFNVPNLGIPSLIKGLVFVLFELIKYLGWLIKTLFTLLLTLVVASLFYVNVAIRTIIVLTGDLLQPVKDSIVWTFDRVYHSHHANLLRQRRREAIQAVSNGLYKFIPLLVVAFIISSLMGIKVVEWAQDQVELVEQYFDPSLKPQEFVVPDYVYWAQPQNKPIDGSSSHYRPQDEKLIEETITAMLIRQANVRVEEIQGQSKMCAWCAQKHCCGVKV